MKKLKRSATDVKLCGVCGGLGEFLGVDSNVVRMIWIVVSLLGGGAGVLVYIAAAILLPKASEDDDDIIDMKED